MELGFLIMTKGGVIIDNISIYILKFLGVVDSSMELFICFYYILQDKNKI